MFKEGILQQFMPKKTEIKEQENYIRIPTQYSVVKYGRHSDCICYFWEGVLVMLLSSNQRQHTNIKSFLHLGKGIQEDQLDKILCCGWDASPQGDGHSRFHWEHSATSVPQRPIVSNPNF